MRSSHPLVLSDSGRTTSWAATDVPRPRTCGSREGSSPARSASSRGHSRCGGSDPASRAAKTVLQRETGTRRWPLGVPDSGCPSVTVDSASTAPAARFLVPDSTVDKAGRTRARNATRGRSIPLAVRPERVDPPPVSCEQDEAEPRHRAINSRAASARRAGSPTSQRVGRKGVHKGGQNR